MLKVILLSCLFFGGNAWAESIEQTKVKAERGDSVAQFDMGLLYVQGQAVAGSQHNLGLLYDIGQGVLQDYKEAAKWYRRSAEQGHAPAQNNLGLLYIRGQGVVQDNKLAHMWWNIAAIDGHENASENREIVAKQMSSEDVSKAQDMAREWGKNHK